MPSDRDYLLVGVTGGIGSGKSIVCAGLEELGRTVLSADRLAREIMDRNETVKTRVRQLFGAAAYTSDGILDRKFVAARVFGDPSARKKLDAIVHPVVFKEIEKQISQLTPERLRPYVVVEAALIFESGLDRQLDYVIVVQASDEARIRRVMERDGCPREEVLRRIAAQLSQEEKVKRADFVIQNNSGAETLEPKIRFIDGLLSRMRKTP